MANVAINGLGRIGRATLKIVMSQAGALDRDPESTSNGSIIEASRPGLGSR